MWKRVPARPSGYYLELSPLTSPSFDLPVLTSSYVYPRMTQKAFDERMRRWMETDWRAEAARILEARLAGHETQKTAFVEVFEL